VARVLAAASERNAGGVGGLQLHFTEHPVLALLGAPPVRHGRERIGVGGVEVALQHVHARDQGVPARHGQVVAQAAGRLVQVLGAGGVAEGAAGKAVQRFVALAQFGIQRAGARLRFDLHAKGIGLGLDVVVGGGRAARVVFVFVQAGGRIDAARARQPQFLARGAGIQAHLSAVVIEARRHAAAVAAFAVVVAVVVGTQRLAVHIHGDVFVLQADGRVELVQAVAAHRAGNAGRHRLAVGIAALGDDVDHAAGGAAAVLHRPAAAHDLDAFDALQRHGAQARRGQVVVVL